MQTDPWKPEQYRLFERERKQPGLDLIALVRPRPAMRVVDLGCGTGELTRELHNHLQTASTLGIDSSEKMLTECARFKRDMLTFQRAQIESFEPGEKLDLVFSNAALQWVPGHEVLLQRFAGWLKDGGQLAVQLPAMEDEVLHVTVAKVAAEEPFRSALGGFVQHLEVHPPQWYAKQLFKLGFSEQQVVLCVYGHRLPNREACIEWMKGTMLTAYQRRLSPELYEKFVQRYREILLPRLDEGEPFFLPYQRILMWAQK